MKLFWYVLAGLGLLVIALAVGVAWRPAPSRDCTSSVIIGRGPHGEPVECVCVNGTVSTCFEPGP
jgi:hypothetical protein